MQKVASEIVFLTLKQHFQDQPEARIMELTIKLQRREIVFHDRGNARAFFPHGLHAGSDRAVSSR